MRISFNHPSMKSQGVGVFFERERGLFNQYSLPNFSKFFHRFPLLFISALRRSSQ